MKNLEQVDPNGNSEVTDISDFKYEVTGIFEPDLLCNSLEEVGRVIARNAEKCRRHGQTIIIAVGEPEYLRIKQ
jgi:hypothetical protein